MIFNGSYWLASRCIYPSSDSSLYCVRTIASNNMDAYLSNLCSGDGSYLRTGTRTDYAIRPVVILKSNVIDTNTNYESEGHLNLK